MSPSTCVRFVKFAVFGVALAGTAAWATPSMAQDVLATHGDWTVYSYVENGKKVCYVGSRPAKEEGTFKKRGDAFVLVTLRANGEEGASKTSEEVSVTSGYPYKDKAVVDVDIGANSFSLFSREAWAWAQNEAGDRELIAAMVRGTNMVVNGQSQIGTTSKDTYSLSGFSAARKAMTEACG